MGVLPAGAQEARRRTGRGRAVRMTTMRESAPLRRATTSRVTVVELQNTQMLMTMLAPATFVGLWLAQNHLIWNTPNLPQPLLQDSNLAEEFLTGYCNRSP